MRIIPKTNAVFYSVLIGLILVFWTILSYMIAVYVIW
jgi:hypothetical protein